MVKSTKEMGEMGRERKRREEKEESRRRAGRYRSDHSESWRGNYGGEREKMMGARKRERMMEERDKCTERIGAEKWKKCAKII